MRILIFEVKSPQLPPLGEGAYILGLGGYGYGYIFKAIQLKLGV